MTSHLLLISIGPVQEFIAQARRTRDLWYGSHILSELGRAAARSLLDGGARLIFPALDQGDVELEPCVAPLRSNGSAPVNVANKLLAEVPAEVDPAALARTARNATRAFWREEIAARVKVSCTGLLAEDIDAAWDEQIDTFLEFLATWAPLDDYKTSRRLVEEAMGARKVLRDFAVWCNQRGTVPKSSLDGGRDTVLNRPQKRERRLVAKYRIPDGEQLDAVGLVKRAGGEPDQFVPIVNVALASWIDLARQQSIDELEALREACAEAGIGSVRTGLSWTAHFPFDAEVLLPDRWKTLFESRQSNGDGKDWGRRYVEPLLKRLSDPYPYVACLVADGDRLGEAIAELGSADMHRLLSSSLVEFARQGRMIIEDVHKGALVYAGGDDILAFVPLTTAVRCADELRRTFSEIVDQGVPQLSLSKRPTLSVGIGVGHIMESMGDLLTLGREAERLAKTGREGELKRNALAIVVDKRSGAKRSWRARWDEWHGDPAARLAADIDLLQERLPSRKVYEIANVLRRLPNPQKVDDSRWIGPLNSEVKRLLSRVEAGEGSLSPDAVGISFDETLGYSAFHRQISNWVERILVSRTLASAIPRVRRHVEVAKT